MSASRSSTASAAVLGLLLAGVAFGAAGGTELGRTTLTEVLVVVLSALALVGAILFGRSGPLHGAGAVALLAGLTALTAFSITWSVAPELSFLDSGRMLAYLALFAAAVGAGRLAPFGAPVAVKGILLAAMAVLAYAFASRVWPGALAENELSNRIGQPYGYWNAVGTTAALAVPAAIWVGARRGGSSVGRALAYPALGFALLAILLTQSRGALAAALLGVIAWFVLVPLRLRSLPVVVLPALITAPMAAWTLSKDAFAKSLQPLSVKESVAGEFGLMLIVFAAVLLLAGLAAGSAAARGLPPVRYRRRIGLAAGLAAAAIPLVLFTSVAFSDKGLGGTIEERVDELTSESADAPTEGAGRFAAASNSRSSFWREAGKVYESRPLVGTGAASFAVSRLRVRKGEQVSRHAHGFVPQTLADLGLLGVALSLALLAAWLVAALRNTSLVPPALTRWRQRRTGAIPPPRDWSMDRVALVALALVPLVFGLQSLVDWTWFVPGPAAMALVGAGYAAGRGPLGALSGPVVPSEPRPFLGRELRLPSTPRLVVATAVGITALLFAWAIWQPEAADRKANSALELVERGDAREAVKEADAAAAANPLAPKPPLVKASAQTAAGDELGALDTLEQTVLRYPGDPQTWYRLAAFQLGTLDRPALALETTRGLLYLDPRSKSGRRLFLDAKNRFREQLAEKRGVRLRALQRKRQGGAAP